MTHQAYEWHTIINSTGARAHALYRQLETGAFKRILDALSVNDAAYARLDHFMLFGAAAILGRDKGGSQAAMQYLNRLNEKTKAITLLFWAQEAAVHLQHLTAIGLLGPLLDSYPKDPELNALMATCHQQAQQLDAGWHYLSEGLKHNPRHVGLNAARCNYQMAEGDLQAAAKTARLLLELDPNNGTAFSTLSRTEPDKITKEQIAHFEALAGKKAVSPINRAGLMFDIGRTHDACGRFDLAFDAVDTANQLMQQIPQGGSAAVNEQAEVADFVARSDLLSSLPALEAPCPVTPVFIVGVPRTGSTLLDQALSSHPEVSSYGESGRVSALVREAAKLLRAGNLTEATRRMPMWRARYLEGALTGGAQPNFVIDKTLQNNRHMAFLKKLFPAAKFLHTRRDFMDTGLSIYFAPLLRAHGYATDLSAIASVISIDEAIMKTLAAQGLGALPVRYEEMVNNTEGTLRSVCAYLNLDWHPDCLRFHEKKQTVHTYSAHQVRRKIYRSSAGRWHNYAAQLKSFQAALQHKGIAA